MLGFGFGATPASALNHNTYNILKNADLHQYCLDITTPAPRSGAYAQLWTCTHPVVGEQELLLVSDNLGADHIKIQRSGYCLDGDAVGATETQVHPQPCDFDSGLQSWDLRDTGEIVNVANGNCLDASPPDIKGGWVVTFPCDGSISQRWFF
jgi:hypothetical protein